MRDKAFPAQPYTLANRTSQRLQTKTCQRVCLPHRTLHGTGANCSTAGDLFCDTPADPKLSYTNVNSSCIYIETAIDPLGVSYIPNTHNFMSYSRKECRDEFSNEQKDMAYSFANSANRLIFQLPTGIYDEVTITSGPSQFKTGESISYQADFMSNNGNTYPVNWDWNIVLYHSGGTYTLASANNVSNLWGVVTTPVLPSYNWTLDQAGNITGEVSATATVNDGSYITGSLTLSVEECNELYIQNQTYTSNTTKQACYVTLENVNVQNGAKLTINSEMGTTIIKDFNVTLGSTLEIE